MTPSPPLEDFLASPEEEAFTWAENGAKVEFFPRWLEPSVASALMDDLMSDRDWEQPLVKVFGKKHLTPRLVDWVGDASYTYSGLTHPPKAWPKSLETIKSRLEELCKTSFNGCLLNLYRDGMDSMGWHSDDEVELGKEPTIASLSLGIPRKFRFRTKKNKYFTPPPEVNLGHGSLLIMAGKTQELFHHGIPKEKTVLGTRLNLTWRSLSY